MRLKNRVAPYAKNRWKWWLRYVLRRCHIRDGRLAELLASDPEDHDKAPRTRVLRWLDGKAAASGASAFHVGDVLNQECAGHWCPPLALAAAAQFHDFAQFLSTLCLQPTTMLLAADFMSWVPIVLEADIAEAQGWLVLVHFDTDHVAEGRRVLRELYGSAPVREAVLVAWDRYTSSGLKNSDMPENLQSFNRIALSIVESGANPQDTWTLLRQTFTVWSARIAGADVVAELGRKRDNALQHIIDTGHTAKARVFTNEWDLPFRQLQSKNATGRHKNQST